MLPLAPAPLPLLTAAWKASSVTTPCLEASWDQPALHCKPLDPQHALCSTSKHQIGQGVHQTCLASHRPDQFRHNSQGS